MYEMTFNQQASNILFGKFEVNITAKQYRSQFPKTSLILYPQDSLQFSFLLSVYITR